MTQADQLARAAEKLIQSVDLDWPSTPTHRAGVIAAAREVQKALAAYRAQADKQGEAEPVAWGLRRADGLILDVICPEEHESHEGDYTIPLYASPHQVAQPLKDEQIEALAHRIAWRYKKSSDPHHSDTYTFNRDTLIQFARAIEAAHGIVGAKGDV